MLPRPLFQCPISIFHLVTQGHPRNHQAFLTVIGIGRFWSGALQFYPSVLSAALAQSTQQISPCVNHHWAPSLHSDRAILLKGDCHSGVQAHWSRVSILCIIGGHLCRSHCTTSCLPGSHSHPDYDYQGLLTNCKIVLTDRKSTRLNSSHRR